MACWSCERPEGEGPLCQACGAVLPPRPGRSHFDVLGVPAVYALDENDLERRFKDLSRKLHPDRFVRAEPRARRFAAEQATALNDAYRLLRDPYRRAEYLLAQAGVEPEAEPALLHEMLERQEALAEARSAGRDADVARLADQMRGRRERALAELAAALADGDGGREAARRHLAAVRYFDRFLAHAEGRQEL